MGVSRCLRDDRSNYGVISIYGFSISEVSGRAIKIGQFILAEIHAPGGKLMC